MSALAFAAAAAWVCVVAVVRGRSPRNRLALGWHRMHRRWQRGATLAGHGPGR
ncbi:hypothetical protein [Trujillonella endophytica]|uniref:Uncharacterized protein n=1 Tax=Trujillonella endophytica TaxID=673521 RepID=A0A1H8QQ23_9ACTN|nr:hypothetical protein [Trujillella endophytica]SEO56091.1 hypothetical protein SAMN05660991_00724 [Trujillella endophytica]